MNEKENQRRKQNKIGKKGQTEDRGRRQGKKTEDRGRGQRKKTKETVERRRKTEEDGRIQKTGRRWKKTEAV